MPTLTQLPISNTTTAADIIPISQGGSTCAVSIGTLLADTQPAIQLQQSSLLGRVSVGPGSPEQISLGEGLDLVQGTLAATGSDHASFPLQQMIRPTDTVVLSSSGKPSLLPVTSLRSLFHAGSNISISAEGTISAGMSDPGASVAIAELTVATSLSAQDLIPVSQDGVTHAASIASLFDGLTLSQASAAASPSETDTLWMGQGSDTMVRQSLGAIASWIVQQNAKHRPLVVEVSVDTILDPQICNDKVLVCSGAITLLPGPPSSDSDFRCDVINLSSQSILLAPGITTSTGQTFLAAFQSMRVFGLRIAGGYQVYAWVSDGTPSSGSVPGQPESVSFTPSSSTTGRLAWSAPTALSPVASYTVSYRQVGSTAWTTVTGVVDTQYSVPNLAPGASYEFIISASNLTGTGAASGMLTITMPSADSPSLSPPSGLTATNITDRSAVVLWTAPTVGQVQTYLVEYRPAGGATWLGFTTGVTSTTFNITGLSPTQVYEWRVTAAGASGASAVSAIASFTTAASSASVSSITWNVVPAGPFARGSGAIGLNAHVSPSSSPVQFGLSTSTSRAPISWVAGTYVNTDLWGAYIPTPSAAGSWFAWAQGADGSAPTASAQAITVT